MPLLLAALMLSAATAPQDQPDPRAPQDRPAAATLIAEPLAMVFAGCDLNRDGLTDKAELHQCLKASFEAQLNGADSTGYLGYGDWAKKWLGNSNALPGPFEIDMDNDNRITLNELEVKFDDIFDRLDVDHDGKVSRAELLTLRNSSTGFGGGGKRRHRRR